MDQVNEQILETLKLCKNPLMAKLFGKRQASQQKGNMIGGYTISR